IGGDSAAIFYKRSGTAQLPIIGAQSRGPSTPLGTMDAGELVLGTSSASDLDFSCSSSTPCRWGDYAGATPDPINPGVVWGSNQVTGPCYFGLCGWFAQWQTRNFAVVASTAPPPPTVPGPPRNLAAIGGNTTADLTWTAPSSDGGSTITNYEIYRGTSPGGEAKVSEVGNVLTFHDTTYYYTVAAVNIAGTGPQSNERSATPQAASFTVSAAPESRSVARGGTTTYAVTVTPSGGFSGQVSLSAAVSPKSKGTTFSFNPQTLNLPATTTSTLTVRVNRNTSRGTYTIALTASGGWLTLTATVTLVVT